MTLLIDLAVQALTDRDARHVLGDAILDAEWYDPRVIALCLPRVRGAKVWRRWHTICCHPTGDWARAVLAALLFGNLEGPWPVAVRSYRPPPSTASMYAVMRRMWPQRRVPDHIFGNSPFLGLVKREKPSCAGAVSNGCKP